MLTVGWGSEKEMRILSYSDGGKMQKCQAPTLVDQRATVFGSSLLVVFTCVQTSQAITAPCWCKALTCQGKAQMSMQAALLCTDVLPVFQECMGFSVL